MIQKPKIQYIGQFYVHGSEARALELEEQKKKAKTKLPLARLEKIQQIYVDPVALAGIAVAVVMLVVMVLGAVRLHQDWMAYERVADRVSVLKEDNVRLTKAYRAGYDLDDIENKALAMGMVPKSELEHITVTVTPHKVEPELTLDQKIVRSWYELWE
nr:hypothetical protein [Oscillospiraceae bacterium]